MEDVGYEGDKFTWRNNNHSEEGYIRERLDRVVVNLEWQELYLNFKVVNGDPRHSNHHPLVIDTGEVVRQQVDKGGDIWFKATWVEEEACRTVVKDAWDKSMLGG